MELVLPPAKHFLLGASAAAGMAHTGDTNETIVATVVIPAGLMGLNGILRVKQAWSFPNNANTKTMRVRFGGIGGTIHSTQAATTTAAYQDEFTIANRGAANSQLGPSNNLSGKVGGSSTALATGAIDTTAAVDLVFTAQCGVGSDQITLAQYIVELLRP